MAGMIQAAQQAPASSWLQGAGGIASALGQPGVGGALTSIGGLSQFSNENDRQMAWLNALKATEAGNPTPDQTAMLKQYPTTSPPPAKSAYELIGKPASDAAAAQVAQSARQKQTAFNRPTQQPDAGTRTTGGGSVLGGKHPPQQQVPLALLAQILASRSGPQF